MKLEPLNGTTSDRLRAGKIAADPLTSPRFPDTLPISTAHKGANLGRRWTETPLVVLYQED